MKKIPVLIASLMLALVGIVGFTASPALANGTCVSDHVGQSQDGETDIYSGHKYHPAGYGLWMTSHHKCSGGLIYVSMVGAYCGDGSMFDVGIRIRFSNGVVGSEKQMYCNSTISVQIGTEQTNPGPTFVIEFRSLWSTDGSPTHMTDALIWT